MSDGGAGKARTEGAAHLEFLSHGAAEPRLTSGGEAAANLQKKLLMHSGCDG